AGGRNRDLFCIAAHHRGARRRHPEGARAYLPLVGVVDRLCGGCGDADPAARHLPLRGDWRGNRGGWLNVCGHFGLLQRGNGHPDAATDAERNDIIDRVLFLAGLRHRQRADAAIRLAFADRARVGRADCTRRARRICAHFADRKLSLCHGLAGCAFRLHVDAVGAAARLLAVRQAARHARLCRREHRGRRRVVRDLARAPARAAARPRGRRAAAGGVNDATLSQNQNNVGRNHRPGERISTEWKNGRVIGMSLWVKIAGQSLAAALLFANATQAEPVGPLPQAATTSPLLVWTKLQSELERERQVISNCRTDIERCSSPAARRLIAIVDEGAGYDDKARVAHINRAANLAIRSTAKPTQDWTSPLAALTTGAGD